MMTHQLWLNTKTIFFWSRTPFIRNLLFYWFIMRDSITGNASSGTLRFQSKFILSDYASIYLTRIDSTTYKITFFSFLGFLISKIHHFDPKCRWQWCWWHRDFGDFMMTTDFRCWWKNHYVGDFIRYVGDFVYVIIKTPTSWIGHQHLKLATNTFGHQHPSTTSK